MPEQEFSGCKVALFIGDKLLITLRDDVPSIPYPNVWDLPGGGREGDETPDQTLAREVMEKVGLTIPVEAFQWKSRYRAAFRGNGYVWFNVARMPAGTERSIVFGDEGQRWDLVTLDAFLSLEEVVGSFAGRIADFFQGNWRVAVASYLETSQND